MDSTMELNERYIAKTNLHVHHVLSVKPRSFQI